MNFIRKVIGHGGRNESNWLNIAGPARDLTNRAAGSHREYLII
jgi:hypothetical protein